MDHANILCPPHSKPSFLTIFLGDLNCPHNTMHGCTEFLQKIIVHRIYLVSKTNEGERKTEQSKILRIAWSHKLEGPYHNADKKLTTKYSLTTPTSQRIIETESKFLAIFTKQKHNWKCTMHSFAQWDMQPGTILHVHVEGQLSNQVSSTHIKSARQGKKFCQKKWKDTKTGQFWFFGVKPLGKTVTNWLELFPWL